MVKSNIKRAMLLQALQDSLYDVNRKQISDIHQTFYDEYRLIFEEQFNDLRYRPVTESTK